MERLSEFRFDFDSIRLIEIESISFEIIENLDYCPALDKAVKYLMQSVNKKTKQRKMWTKLQYKKKHSIVHEYFQRSDDAEASKVQYL